MHVQDGQEVIEEWDESEPISHLRGNRFIAILAWFLLCAALMWPVNQLHMGFVGLVIAMATAILILLWVRWLVSVIRRKMAGISLTRRQWAEMAMGVEPGEAVDEAEPDPTLASGEAAQNSLATRRFAQTTALQPYSQQRIATLDEEDPPDTVIEKNGMYFSNHFMPALAPMLGQIVLVCGNRGAGKSNLLGVAAEEIAREEPPILFIDAEDQYSPLAERTFFPRGFVAGDPSLQFVQKIPLRHFIQVNITNAYDVGYKLLQHTLQLVFNMKSYLTDEEAALVLCELIRGMVAWEEAKENGDRLPCVIFFDEANKFLPQDMRESIVSRSTQEIVYRTFFGLVNRGRNYGFSVWFATQRIQQIHKSLLQALYKFLFYQTQKVDLEQYAVFGLEPEDVFSLQRGECYIFTPTIIGLRCLIRERVSPHLGHTPGLEQLHAYQAQHVRPIQTLTGGTIAGERSDPHHNGSSGKMHEQLAFPGNRSRYREPILMPATTSDSRIAHVETGQQSRLQTYNTTTTGTEKQHRETTPPQSSEIEQFEINGVPVSPMQKLAYELHMKGNQTIMSLATAMTRDRRFGDIDTNVAYRLRNELDDKGLISIQRKGKSGR